MLTLTHVVDEQAASLAACPRPRALALAPSVVSWSAFSATSVVLAVRVGSGSAAAVRPVADERPSNGEANGYRYGLRRHMAGFGFGSVQAAPAGAAASGGTIERTISSKQDEQAQQNLTHRREPRPWRPPH